MLLLWTNPGWRCCHLSARCFSMQQYHVCYARSADLHLDTQERQEVLLIQIVHYDQWWASWIVGAIARRTVLQSKRANFLIFIAPQLVNYWYFSNKNTFKPKKKKCLFPYISIEKLYKCSSIFQQNVANFDFNCEYLENASTSRLLIWYNSISLQPLHDP